MAPVTLKALPATSIIDPSSQSKRATIQVMPIASIQPMPGEAEKCWTQEVRQTLQILDAVLGLGSCKRPSWKALAHEREGFIEVVVLAKLTGPNDCRLRRGGTASQVMCNLILSQSKSTEASALKK